MLNNKTILITGASRGIGRASVEICKQNGARILAHASGPSAPCEALIADGLVEREDLILEDFSQKGAGTRLFERAIAQAPDLDCVVNNAGVYLASPVDDAKAWDEGWAQTMNVNVHAVADICRAAITYFSAKGGGSVVNIASRAGHRGDGPDHSAYAASKGAILAMTKTFARAYAGEGVLFYAIAPGWVETRMAPQDIENRKLAIRDIPLGKVANPAEVGALIAFLASGQCPSLIGATLDVNGASYVR